MVIDITVRDSIDPSQGSIVKILDLMWLREMGVDKRIWSRAQLGLWLLTATSIWCLSGALWDTSGLFQSRHSGTRLGHHDVQARLRLESNQVPRVCQQGLRIDH